MFLAPNLDLERLSVLPDCGRRARDQSPSGSDRLFSRMNLFEGLHRNLNYPGLHFMTTRRADRHPMVAPPPRSLRRDPGNSRYRSCQRTRVIEAMPWFGAPARSLGNVARCGWYVNRRAAVTPLAHGTKDTVFDTDMMKELSADMRSKGVRFVTNVAGPSYKKRLVCCLFFLLCISDRG